MYGKLFAQMYDGTLGTKGPWQALVTFQQLIILADKEGTVDKTPEAIARITTIPLEIIQTGIQALELPDPDSRTPDEEGRRIVRLSESRAWGWRIVNYGHYRKIRSAEERREYMRGYMRDYRAGDKAEQEETAQDSPLPVNQNVNKLTAGEQSKPIAVSSMQEAVSRGIETTATDTAPAAPVGGAVADVSENTKVALAQPNGAVQVSGNGKGAKAVEIRQRLEGVLKGVVVNTERRHTKEAWRKAAAELVFAYWAARTGHDNAVLDGKREARLIRAMRESGDNIDELLYAVDGCLRDDHLQGRTRDSDGRKYDGVQTVFRDREQVERLAGLVPDYRAKKPHKMAEKYARAIAGDAAAAGTEPKQAVQGEEKA
jgi:hypothetical protein